MSETLSEILTIDADQAGQRLDKFLSRHEKILSRSKAAKLIDLKLVEVNKKIVKSSYALCEGDQIHVQIPVEKVSVNVATQMDLDIIFEDQDLIVLNKPAGLVVHPATSHQTDTLVNGLLAHTKDLSMGFNEERPGIVHRIDKDTSGLLVVAKNDSTHRHLAEQFKEKTVHRIYWALVYGKPKNSPFRIESHLGRHEKNRKKFASQPDHKGKLAITHGETIEFSPSGMSLVKLKLETGRTHQIRVHLSEQHTPIVGDDLYCNPKRANHLKSTRLRKHISDMNRFALHAAELGFIHPRINKELLFSVGWPDDLLELVNISGLTNFTSQ